MMFPLCIRNSSLIISDWVHCYNWIASAMQDKICQQSGYWGQRDTDFLPYYFCGAMWLRAELDSQLRSQGTCSEAFGVLIKQVLLWKVTTNREQRRGKEASAKEEKKNLCRGNANIICSSAAEVCVIQRWLSQILSRKAVALKRFLVKDKIFFRYLLRGSTIVWKEWSALAFLYRFIQIAQQAQINKDKWLVSLFSVQPLGSLSVVPCYVTK